MDRYAELVRDAIAQDHSMFEAEVVRLALSERALRRFPGPIRNWVHHVAVAVGTRLRRHRFRADILHVLDGSHAYVTGCLSGVPTVATSHDIIPYLQIAGRLGGRKPGGPAKALVRASIAGLRRVDRIVADSECTRRDLIEVAGIRADRIDVVHPALDPSILDAARRRPVSWSDRRRAGDAYVLHVGNSAFYKNREGAIRVFAMARAHTRDPVRLRMAGPPPTPAETRIAREMGIAGLVDFVHPRNDEDLCELYRAACLFIFPSLYEGFGWPPLEAMAFGCPVVASSAASLPEVVGPAALTAPPTDEQKLAEHCASVLNDRDLAAHLERLGRRRVEAFSLDAMRRDLLAAYARVLGPAMPEARHS